MPKRPRSFGPVAIGIGLFELAHSRNSFGRPRERAPRRGDESPDLGLVLDAGRALDAGGDIDAAGAAQRDRRLDRFGVESRRRAAMDSGDESPAPGSSRRDGRCRPAAPRPSAAWRRSAGDRRRPRRLRRRRSPRARRRRSPSSSGGRRVRRSASPAPEFRCPCNCMRSGDEASTMRLSVSSSASTLSATIFARPRACRPSARAVAQSIWRGLLEKNTNPTMSAPASSAASRVAAVERPQILTTGVIARFFRSKRPRCQRPVRKMSGARRRRSPICTACSPASP